MHVSFSGLDDLSDLFDVYCGKMMYNSFCIFWFLFELLGIYF